jgi:hypothetical protein
LFIAAATEKEAAAASIESGADLLAVLFVGVDGGSVSIMV